MMAEQVAVYSFPKYEIVSDEISTRPVKGTLQAITDIVQSKPIMSSEEFVDASLLDGDGFYRPSN
jgi:hypothetical protein